jgi:hypothetical protein
MKKAVELINKAKSALYDLDMSESFREHDEGVQDEVVSFLDEAIAELRSPPRWETPEQREKRTGEKWPDSAPVFHCYIDGGGFLVRLWEVGFYRNYRSKNKPLGLCVVCATEAGPPPDGWRPGGGTMSQFANAGEKKNKRTPQTCKYCDHKTNPEECPHFERKNGHLPDNGRCKKFKKRKQR